MAAPQSSRFSGNLHVTSKLSTNERIGNASSPKISSGLCGALASHVTAWQSVSAPEWVICTITTGTGFSLRGNPHVSAGLSLLTRKRNSAYNLKDEISGCGLRDAPTLEQTPVLLPVFSGPQEGRCSPSYLGSKSVEKTFEEMRKYNFRMLIHAFFLFNKREQLVYIGRSERYFLP